MSQATHSYEIQNLDERKTNKQQIQIVSSSLKEFYVKQKKNKIRESIYLSSTTKKTNYSTDTTNDKRYKVEITGNGKKLLNY